jgi:hypothetical protein
MVEKITAQIQQRIDSAIMAIAETKPRRNYLGASSIGEECDRKLWYSYHVGSKIMDPRVHRIMDFGHFSESYIVAMLKAAGYEMFIEDENGKQFGFDDEEVAGNSDGVIIIDGVPHLFEAKSANDKRFNEMVKVGVEKSDPTYFVQMQVYMKYLELTQALFFVINKNNGAIHMEIIKYEKIKADYAVNRGKEIIRSEEEEANRKYSSAAFFKCKWCDYRSKCWGSQPPEPTEKGADPIKLGGNFLVRK